MQIDASTVPKWRDSPDLATGSGHFAHLTDGELLDQYIACRDERAFECLMRRHGPMVLGVCTRTLKNRADAEDAFQATFLVFVHKAASIRPRRMVGNWLYGVARNTALKARAMSAKRLAKENKAVRTQSQTMEPSWDDLQRVLDLELSCLPNKYRSVIVLCDIEGSSLRDAARHLNCPLATVGTRLARGRQLLARRLGRRGLTVSVVLLTMLLSENAALAAVSTELAATTIKAASLVGSGTKATASIVPPTVAALMMAVLKSLLLVRLKFGLAACIVLVSVGFVSGAIATQARQGIWPFKFTAAPCDWRVMQGKWELVRLEVAGKEIPPEQFQDYAEWKLEGERFRISIPEKAGGVFRNDESIEPKNLDFILEIDKSPRHLPKLHGNAIYLLEDQTLTICLGELRPDRFVSTDGPNPTSLFVLHKKKKSDCCASK